MRISLTLLLGALCCLTGRPVDAREAWLLLHHEASFAVVRVSGDRLEKVVDVSSQTTYGVSERAIGVFTSGVLQVIDRASGSVTSWPVKGYPVADVSGPIGKVLLIDDVAWFPSVRFPATDRNAAGGYFDLNRVSLADGAQSTIALPVSVTDPRVARMGKVPLVYSENLVWKIDGAHGELVPLVSRAELDQALIERERVASQSGQANLGPFTDYAFVPDAGIFRLSRLGQVTQVLEADMSTKAGPRRAVRLGPPKNILKIFPGTFAGHPTINVIRRKDRELVLSAVNLRSLVIEAQTPLPPGAEPLSCFASTSGSVTYVDRETGAIEEVNREGITTIGQVTARPDLVFARVLWVDDAR
jgi:hypothetical protein